LRGAEDVTPAVHRGDQLLGSTAAAEFLAQFMHVAREVDVTHGSVAPDIPHPFFLAQQRQCPFAEGVKQPVLQRREMHRLAVRNQAVVLIELMAAELVASHGSHPAIQQQTPQQCRWCRSSNAATDHPLPGSG
jgi:hypothetical protein